MSRKVMMALAPAGGGHTSVGRAISEALAQLAPDVAVSTVNVFSREFAYFPLTAILTVHARLTTDMPAVWRGLFKATEGRRYAPVERLSEPIMRPALRAALDAVQPDVIVSLNPAIGYTLSRSVRELGWSTPIGVVVSDLVSIHPAWFCRGAAWHTVPTEEARQAFLDAGFDPATIHLTGLPVGQGFCRGSVDRAELRRTLGLPAEGHVVLIVGGGGGFGGVDDTVEALQASGLPCHLVVVCGRNRHLRRRLLEKADQRSCRALGYVSNMADWMHAADVLVTKAGPNTIMEAVHCGLPMVLTGAIPGQEEGNLGFAAGNGVALVAARPAEIVAAIGELLTDGELVAQLRGAMQRLRRPEAALDIARLIVESR